MKISEMSPEELEKAIESRAEEKKTEKKNLLKKMGCSQSYNSAGYSD